jgi:hypothetical protein
MDDIYFAILMQDDDIELGSIYGDSEDGADDELFPEDIF